MDKDTILNYVTETPGNTNRAVLGSMLDSIDSGGGSPSNVEIVNIEVLKINNDTTVTSDKTYSDINEAWNSGKIIVFKIKDQVDNNPYSIYCELPFVTLDGATNTISFIATHIYGFYSNTLQTINVKFDSNGDIIVY